MFARPKEDFQILPFLGSIFLTGLVCFLYTLYISKPFSQEFIQLESGFSLHSWTWNEIGPEPLLFKWNQILRIVLSSRTSLILMMSLGVSLYLHILLYLIHRKLWRLNHYIFIWILAISPMAQILSIDFLPEVYSAIFLGLFMLVFKFEEIPDLIVVPSFLILAFFSSLVGFFAYILPVTVFLGFYNIQKEKSQRSVFFKKKSIPLIASLVTLGIWAFVFFLFYTMDFFGPGMFSHQIKKGGLILAYTIGCLILMAIHSTVLHSEKELNTPLASGILIAMFFITGYYTVFHFSPKVYPIFVSPLDKDIPRIPKNIKIFGSTISNQYTHALGRGDLIGDPNESSIYFYWNDVYQADIKDLEKKFGIKTKSTPPLIVLKPTSVLIQKTYWDEIQSQNIDQEDIAKKTLIQTLNTKLSQDSFPKSSYYLIYCRFFQELLSSEPEPIKDPK